MNLNIYHTSLLKHMNLDFLRKSLPSVKLSTRVCYTMSEEYAFKHDQGKALETVVIPDVQDSNANIVCLESGVNEVTKISRSEFNLKTMHRILRNRVRKLVDFAENIITTTKCQNCVLVKMMPRFDYDDKDDSDAAMFLKYAHVVWNNVLEDLTAKKNVNIQLISILAEQDILESKEKLYGKRDGIHLAGAAASNTLPLKLGRALSCIMYKQWWHQLCRNKEQVALTTSCDISIPSLFSFSSTQTDSTPSTDWNDIVAEDEAFQNLFDSRC